MPAATTHVEFARDVYQQLASPSFVDDSLFYLGSQGPDVLFFSRASGFLPGTIKKLGDQMHTQKVKETIEYMYQYCLKHPILMNYYYGYLCHYAADSTCHPIVFYYAKKLHEEAGISEYEMHVILESCVDVWCLEKHGKKMEDYDVYKYLHVTGSKKKELAKLYQAIFRDVYQLDVPLNKFEGAITSIYHITKLLRPSSRSKYTTFYKLESLLNMKRTVSSLMLEDKDPNHYDILNKNNQSYPHDGHKKRVSTSSFEELYQEGVEKAVTWINKGGVPNSITLDFSGIQIK